MTSTPGPARKVAGALGRRLGDMARAAVGDFLDLGDRREPPPTRSRSARQVASERRRDGEAGRRS